MEEKLSILEKRAVAKGLASRDVRLKAGRLIWDELDAELLPAKGKAEQDVNRLYVFKNMVEDRPYYEKRALKEWLEAQVGVECFDLLGDDSERSKMILIYKEHLALL